MHFVLNFTKDSIKMFPGNANIMRVKASIAILFLLSEQIYQIVTNLKIMSNRFDSADSRYCISVRCL